MSRSFLLFAVLVCAHSVAAAGDTKSDAEVEREILVQNAIKVADRHLAANAPAAAVAALEAQLPNANGSTDFLTRLRRAYAAELQQLAATAGADSTREEQIRRKLALLGGGEEPSAPRAPVALLEPTVTPTEPAAVDSAALLRDARALFKAGKYAEAGAKFAAVAVQKAPMTSEEVDAWVYCRLHAAADVLNRPGCDALAATAAEKDVTEALALTPTNARLQQVGQKLLAVARQRKVNPVVATAPVGAPGPLGEGLPSPVPGDWGSIETANFRVRFRGDKERASEVARVAEAQRVEAFKRWGGGMPGTNWSARCEIVLHPSAEVYAQATGKPAAGTGHATVRVTEGRVIDRRIDLRTDDDGLVVNTLPRELTHVVLVDLFPFSPPPKWAEVGMAILAESPDEVSRYTRRLARLAPAEMLPTALLLEQKDFPAAEKITAFYCQSVALVDYLVRLKGEQTFTLFLRGCKRYGVAKSLKEHYGLDGPQALDQAWRQPVHPVTRGQAP